MKYEEILSLLPSELLVEGNANNIKKVLSIYSTITGVGDELNEDYGAILDIYGATGQQLDFIGAMFAVFRYDLEADETYRTRIFADIINKKTPTTIPELQQAIDSVVLEGRLYILENHDGKPCNVYLTGTADGESTAAALKLVRGFLPAGIKSIIPVVSFATWNNVKTQFSSWQAIGDDGFIW